jgi:tRNA(Ile)-lysidine synthase TilS/MesJ
MTWSLPKYYNRRISRAIAEFDLIEDGDKIIVGFSGGKDSAFLVYSLAVLQKHLAIDFDLRVLTIDLGFNEQAGYTELKEFCEQLEVDYDLKRTKIAQTVLEANQPCAKCSYFRKGAMTDYSNAQGFNKIALGLIFSNKVQLLLSHL